MATRPQSNLLHFPDLHAEILGVLFNAYPRSMTISDMMQQVGNLRFQLWHTALIDLEQQELVRADYDVRERRAYFSLPEKGRMHLLSLVLIGQSDALPTAVSQPDGFAEGEDMADVSEHLQLGGRAESPTASRTAMTPPETLVEMVERVQGPTIQDRAEAFKKFLAEWDAKVQDSNGWRDEIGTDAPAEIERWRDR